MINPFNNLNNFQHENHSSEHTNLNATAPSNQNDFLNPPDMTPPESKQTLVEFLKEEIASGRYQVESKQIAARMLDDMQV